MKKPDLPMSKEALFRYQVVSNVLTRVSAGETLSKSVKHVAGLHHLGPDGERRRIGKRTIYRWVNAYEEKGFAGLLPKERPKTEDSTVLDRSLLDYFVEQKTEDPLASIPELILRARIIGHLKSDEVISRVTVWRALNRMGISTSHRKSAKNLDSRRFAFPHRMDMVLCDGKHFRAGINRVRRVALFFLDDATRHVLHVVVGPSESTQLFLRGLYGVILKYGFMTALFTDHGSAFISGEAVNVLGKLEILFVHGAKGYPEGHGKIERFNRTAKEQVIRSFDGNPTIDAGYENLTLRLQHYIDDRYAGTVHEKLDGQTPLKRFQNDTRPLRFAQRDEELRRAFVLYAKRRVSNDNVIQWKGTDYEVPGGHAGERITIHRNLLDDSMAVIHQGRLVRIEPVDLSANARSKRADKKDLEETAALPSKCSAQMAFEQDYQPVVDADGGFTGKE